MLLKEKEKSVLLVFRQMIEQNGEKRNSVAISFLNKHWEERKKNAKFVCMKTFPLKSAYESDDAVFTALSYFFLILISILCC